MRDTSAPSVPDNQRTDTTVRPRTRSTWGLMGICTAALLAACAAPIPAPPPPPPPPPPAPAPAPAPAPVAALPAPDLVSNARTPRDYRRDGARHLYNQNATRIFHGRMPPLLQGVGVMRLDIDGRGNLIAMNWLRAPSHAGAKEEIERTVRAAVPFPAPMAMGQVAYTDTWLWDRSGKFQLDTLTEGQNDR